MYSIAVCDDNREFTQSLLKICGEILTAMNISCRLTGFYSAQEVLAACDKGEMPDLLILDIRLGQKNGIDLARRLRAREEEISIILMSADSSYLLDGYSVQPIYFLLKPISRDELSKAISVDLKRRLRNESITIRCGHSPVQVSVRGILYLEVMDHSITLHTVSGDYTTRASLSQILELLPPGEFARCHNSYAVNLSRVSGLSRGAGVTLDGHIRLPIGRKYYREFQPLFISHFD